MKVLVTGGMHPYRQAALSETAEPETRAPWMGLVLHQRSFPHQPVEIGTPHSFPSLLPPSILNAVPHVAGLYIDRLFSKEKFPDLQRVLDEHFEGMDPVEFLLRQPPQPIKDADPDRLYTDPDVDMYAPPQEQAKQFVEYYITDRLKDGLPPAMCFAMGALPAFAS